MAFFEDLGKKISQTSQGAVQKAKDTAEILKLNGMISDEEKRINSFYTEIGKKYFELHADDCEAVLVGMINSVKASKSKIDEYSNQIKQLKGVAKCPNCGSDVQNGSPFCSFCGVKLEVAAPAKPNTIRCANCGSEVSADSAFCTNCGNKLAVQASAPKVCVNCGKPVGDSLFCTNCGTKVENTPPAVAAVPVELTPDPIPVQPAPAPVPPVQPTAVICSNCGAVLAAGTLFCTSCGCKAEAAPTIAPVQPAEPSNPVPPEQPAPAHTEPTADAQPQAKFCTNCGNKIDGDAVFCTNCGKKL